MSNVTPVVIAILAAELSRAATLDSRASESDASSWAAARGARPASGAAATGVRVPRGFGAFVSLGMSFNMRRPAGHDCLAAEPGRAIRSRATWELARCADSAHAGPCGRFALVRFRLASGQEARWASSCWWMRACTGFWSRLTGAGFDFHLHWSDWKTGLRELAYFAPVVLGVWTGAQGSSALTPTCHRRATLCCAG